MEEILIEEYNYPLPDERIAKYPLAERDQSKLLIYRDGQVSEDHFHHIGKYLPADSLLIYNNTRVIQARLEFHKTTATPPPHHTTQPLHNTLGARIEIFCLEPLEPHDYQLSLGSTEGCTWKCMIGNAKKWKTGTLSLPVQLPSGEQITLFAEKGEQTGNTFAVRFWWNTPASNLSPLASHLSFAEILDAVGELPIPPYLNRKTEESDKTTYQTVYSRIKGSVAAPTAGLHFTDALLDKIRGLKNYQHRILYYGPHSKRELAKLLENNHAVADTLIPVQYQSTPNVVVTEPKVVFAQYDAKQIYYMQYTCGGDMFDVALDPQTRLYNEYFSGGMNAIVFQEMREARGLAYSSYAYLGQGNTCHEPYYFYAFIATQNDKMQQAIEAFDEIIENMPQSEAAFELTKQGLLTGMATGRTTKMDVLWKYIGDMRFGITDINRTEAIYNAVQTMTLADVVEFQQSHVKGNEYIYCILGDKNDVDMKYLKSLGKVEFVSQEQIFGY